MARKVNQFQVVAALSDPLQRDPRASDAYMTALQEARRHHVSSKTYSGKFLRPHAPFIKDVMERLQCTSILDYGCGKGKQYEWVSHGDDTAIPKGMTLADYWANGHGPRPLIYLFDPAWPPHARPPGPDCVYDLVLCTHALGSIPIADLGWVVDELIARARKAVYIAEKIGPVTKEVFSQPELMPRWSAAQWREFIGARPHPGIEITVATREKRVEGVIVERVRV